MLIRKLAVGASTAVLAMAAASAVYAQETTGGIRGQVSNENGVPVSNATVTVVHQPTGTASRAVTSDTGAFALRNLRVGGPYVVTVSAAGYESDPIEVGNVNVGDPLSLPITVWSAAAQVEDVIVTGSRTGGMQTGPRTRISADDIDSLPSISRDLRDFARTSPFVTLDQSNGDAMSIAGASNRVNALYVDGIRQGDDFGLNANGYPGQRSPLSIATVAGVSVEVAPFDVQYSFFQGGLINVVTRGGGNDLSGEIFYEYTDNSLRGDSFTYVDNLTGLTRTVAVNNVFEERTWGATLSGPIIRDRLFFLLNYESFTGTEPSEFGPSGSGASSEIPGVTQADVDNVRNIMQTVYGYDPLGAQVSNIETTAEQYLVRLDWNINADHRAVLSWQHTEDGRLSQTGNSVGGRSLSLLSKYYTLDTELDVYRFQLFSNWTDNFSTEIALGLKETTNISSPLGGSDFAEFRVYLAGGTGPSIYLGPDISRQANQLTNDLNQFRFRGTYQAGDHRITFGFEREDLSIFNLFVQRATGQYVFNSVADLQLRRAQSLQYSSAASNIAEDGGARFGYAVNSWYAQDEYDVTPDLTLRLGFRWDTYSSDDIPQANPLVLATYGISNTSNLDGRGVFQPRVGFTWTPDDLTTIYGGVGLFGGGSPNVWISNNYTNTGNLLGFVSCTRANMAVNCPAALDGVDGFNVGAGAQTANTNSANLGTGNINLIDPDFHIPSVWKFSLGGQRVINFTDMSFGQFLGDGWRVRGELLWSDTRHGVNWIDLNQEDALLRAAPDGRPVYGPRANQTVLMLTNTTEGRAFQWAVGVGRDWYEGWAQGLGFDLSYTHLDSEDVQPGTSSVATSNYRQVATAYPNNPELAISNYQFESSWKLDVSYSRAFFGDYLSRFRMFAQRRSGLPFSYTYDDVSTTGGATGMFGENSLYTSTDRQLVYVPMTDASGVVTAGSDPIIRYAPGFDFAGFNTFLQNSGLIDYAGQITPRNAFQSEPYTTVDLRLSQEIPAFFPSGARVEAYMDIENFGNLLNDEWGVLQQTGFPYMNRGITARNCQTAAGACANGVGNFYEYTGFNTGADSNVAAASVWQIKFGIRYRF